MLVCRGEVREFGLTGLTRNQVSLTAPGVRIPPSPPTSLHLRIFRAASIRNPRVFRRICVSRGTKDSKFDPHRENFGSQSLLRILLVPRESVAQTGPRRLQA